MRRENRDIEERWKEKSRQMFDTSEARKALENVFDHQTRLALMKMMEEGVIEKMYGNIEAGKESMVFLADTPDGERVVVKIYMTQAGGFRNMRKYLLGDKRFRGVKKDRRSVIYNWCKKEYKNLKSASEAVRCPKPVAARKNILVMEFFGEEFDTYPKLKNVEFDEYESAYEEVVDGIAELWHEIGIVHGDLSEYNIIVKPDGELVWIDFSQGVHKTHPEAHELVKRDIKNIAQFFARRGVDTTPEKAYKRVFPEEETVFF